MTSDDNDDMTDLDPAIQNLGQLISCLEQNVKAESGKLNNINEDDILKSLQEIGSPDPKSQAAGAVTIAPPLSYREKLSQKPHFWPIVFEKIISKTRQKPQYFCLLPRFLACFWQEGQGQTRVG